MTERASKPLTARPLNTRPLTAPSQTPRPQTAPKGRRPHPARNARLITTGAAASLTLGVVVALAFSDASAASHASAAIVVEQPAAELAPISTVVTPRPAPITVIRRVHYLPSATTLAPVPQAAVDAIVFSPKPAVRASVAAVSPRKAATVRRAVVKRHAPTRRARRATRAS